MHESFQCGHRGGQNPGSTKHKMVSVEAGGSTIHFKPAGGLLKKAYPRVSKDGLWALMKRKGAPDGFINVCKALHEHTEYKVRIH